jgi:hypothetical protein
MSPSVSSHKLWSSTRWLIAEKDLNVSSHRERGRAENDGKQRAERESSGRQAGERVMTEGSVRAMRR